MTQRIRLALIVTLIGCGGSTLRVAKDDPADSTPVALAPSPETGPDSIPTAPSSPGRDSAPADSSAAEGYAPYSSSPQGDLEIRRIGEWTNTGVSESRRLVIRDANAWAQFWSELGVGERPLVDFTRDLVLAVAAGQRPSGGYEIAIQKVTQKNGELTIEVQETTPGPNCMTTSAITQPVDVITVPSAGVRSWSFLERTEVRSCR